MPVNLNFDGNALVEWVARPVALRADSYAKDAKRRKLIAMAKECATKLKIADWDVVVWPPERVSMALIDILRSTDECSSASGCARVAAEVCGKDYPINHVSRLVCRYFRLDSELEVVIDNGADAIEACMKILDEFAENQDIQNEFAENEDISSFVNRLVTSEPMKERGSSLFPLWTIPEISLPFKWDGNVLTTYRDEWESTIAGLVNSKTPIGTLSPKDEEMELDLCKSGLCLLDVLVMSKTAKRMGIDLLARNEWIVSYDPFIGGEACWWNAIPNNNERKRVMFEVATQFLYFVLMGEYRHFLSALLQQRSRSSVGMMTNILLLRNKHVFGKAVASKNSCVWETFVRSLSNGTVDFRGNVADTVCGEVDLLSAMCEVLGGHVYATSSIQLSIVDKTLGVDEIEKGSFLGRISRRHVRLLYCGNDRALVIPYLNKILLKLSDNRWVRDNDVHALQPFDGFYSESAIRRAANVLLAMEYQRGVGATVNDVALNMLKKYARKGELYSMDLRDDLLSVLTAKDRVCIRALTVWARDVAGNDDTMVAGLVREMIHDRLFFKSDIDCERKKNENDAYYDTVYLRRENFAVRNNVDWGPGVPMAGIRGVSSTVINGGIMGPESVSGIRVGSGKKVLTFWYVEPGKGRPDDIDKSSMFLSNPEWSEEQVNKLPAFQDAEQLFERNLKVGRYCPDPVTTSFEH